MWRINLITSNKVSFVLFVQRSCAEYEHGMREWGYLSQQKKENTHCKIINTFGPNFQIDYHLFKMQLEFRWLFLITLWFMLVVCQHSTQHSGKHLTAFHLKKHLHTLQLLSCVDEKQCWKVHDQISVWKCLTMATWFVDLLFRFPLPRGVLNNASKWPAVKHKGCLTLVAWRTPWRHISTHGNTGRNKSTDTGAQTC